MHFFTAAAHLSASHRQGDGENLSHWLHGATLERQPEMFDQAPEKRSLNRYTALKDVCNLSVFNGTVKQQWLTKDSAVCPRSSFSNCAKAQERKQRLTGASTLVLFVRSRDVTATTAAVLLLLCCCCCAAADVLLLLLFHDPRCIAEHDPQC